MEIKLRIFLVVEKEGNVNYRDFWFMLGSYNCSYVELYLIYMFFEIVNDYIIVI